jgi:diguanylate cyclase (GGDEF)-like protein
MAEKIRVLYIEDDEADQYIVRRVLSRGQETEVELVTAVLLAEGLERLTVETCDVVILDLDLPDTSLWSPEKALAQVLLLVPETPVIVVSNIDDKAVQLKMVAVGAQDFLVKAEVQDRLVTAIEFAIVRSGRILELRQAAMQDDLTGLYNRRGFNSMWSYQRKVAERQKKRLSVILADVDGLKQINDRCGHLEGNEALKKVARILDAHTRPDDIVARLSGDEFLVLTLRDPVHDDRVLIRRFKAAFDDYNAHSGKPYLLTASFGSASAHLSQTLEQVLDLADRRMYEDKAANKLAASGSVERLPPEREAEHPQEDASTLG